MLAHADKDNSVGLGRIAPNGGGNIFVLSLGKRQLAAEFAILRPVFGPGRQ